VEIVLGNKRDKLSREEIMGLSKCYDRTIIDLGTGDGRFVFKNALKNPDNFFIGVDPSEKQLKIYSKKAARKRLPNVIFGLGSLEIPLDDLKNTGDELFVILPWGTLLQNIVLPSRESVKNLSNLLKRGGKLVLVFGYHREFEPSETERLKLPKLTEDYIRDSIVSEFEKYGFKLEALEKIGKKELKRIETTWCKKLSFGKIREIFKLVMIIPHTSAI
jgi:16S rRNA (adenine(1408)-N(1))-methyltransferase